MSDKDFVGFKIQIYPTKEQEEIFNRYFGVSRYVYNYGIDEEEKEYRENGGFLRKYDLNNRFTEFKNREENSWLLDYDGTTLKIVLFDVVNAYKKFFSKNTNHPKYKSKKISYQSYPIRPERMSIRSGYVRIPGIDGNIQCGHIPNEYCIGKGYQPITNSDYRKYRAARISYDGCNYYLSFEMDVSEDLHISSYDKYHEQNESKPYSDTIGVDLGCSKNNWIVDSNGVRVSLPDTTKEDKKIKHFQRKLQRQIKTSRTKKRSKNRLKTIRTINKYYKKRTNKKINAIHNYVSHEIIEKKPLAVVIEDIKVRDMMWRDKDVPKLVMYNFNRNIQDHMLFTVQRILTYKCDHNDIKIVKAHKEFPSSQRCSSCGNILDIGKKKTYKCPKCRMVMNRDDNAARNLAQYPTLSFNNV